MDEIGLLVYPPPRVEVVQHPDGEILVVHIRRSQTLVPCIESKERVFYVRLYDSTKAVPPYLVHDLLLGRRQHPRLEARLRDVNAIAADSTGTAGLVAIMDVQNTSLVRAPKVVCGVIGYGSPRNFPTDSRTSTTLFPDFRSHLDVRTQRRHPHQLIHAAGFNMAAQRNQIQSSSVDLAPFESGRFNLGLRLPPQPPRMSWSGAIYFVAEGSPPEWYELRCQYDFSASRCHKGRVRRVGGYERPHVSIRAAMK